MKIFELISEVEFMSILFFAILIGFLMKYFNLTDTTQNLDLTFKNFLLLLPDYTVTVMLKIFTFSFFLSTLLIFVVVWTAIHLMRIRKGMNDKLALPNQEGITDTGTLQPVINEKWEKVIRHINSTNPSDWKLAILECDIMLSDILEKMGYMQASIGEKLKSIEPSDFTNIEAAWEAHKIRNMIAHEGTDFLINEREAKRVIGLYELVFREFEYI